MSAFGHYLVERIAAAGYRSPTSFAKAAGLDPSIVLRWISGRVTATPETLRRAAPVLGVSISELLSVALAMPEAPPPPPLPLVLAEFARLLGPDSPLDPEGRELLTQALEHLLALVVALDRP